MNKSDEFILLANALLPGSRSGFASDDAAFFFWCANNREFLASSMRLRETVDNPNEETLIALGDAATHAVMYGWTKGAGLARAILKKLLEIVR